MLLKIKSLLKTIFSDARQAIIGFLALAVFVWVGTLLYQSKTLLHASIEILKTATPVWATIALVLLCCLYIYLKTHTTNQSLQKSSSILIEIGQFKWKTTIHKNGNFDVFQIPYCKEHEIKLVPHGIGYFCPALQLGCKSQIKKKDIKVQHDTAKSFIEGMINKTSKC